MSAPQTFRSAFNGFNREDVVHYLEYINTKYQNQIDQLTAENQELQAAAQRRPLVDQDDLREYLQAQPSEELDAAKARCEELTALLDAEKARCQELEQQLAAEKTRCEELAQQLENTPQDNTAAQMPAPVVARAHEIQARLEVTGRSDLLPGKRRSEGSQRQGRHHFLRHRRHGRSGSQPADPAADRCQFQQAGPAGSLCYYERPSAQQITLRRIQTVCAVFLR